MANPALLDSFAGSSTNKVAPSAGLQADGYSFEEILASGNYNYMIEQLFAAANKSKDDGIWDWESGTYNLGSLVRHNNMIWVSKTASNISEPGIANWEQFRMSGKKNLLINGRGTHQQRGVTGGRIQVVLNTRNLGGSHTISWTGTATVTIKEATTLAASDALTTWDAALVTGASSGTTVTLTAGKYVHVEFSTTDWDFALLEFGSVATNYPILEDTIEECYPYFRSGVIAAFIGYGVAGTNIGGRVSYSTIMRVPPLLTLVGDPASISNVNVSTIGLTADDKSGFYSYRNVVATGSAQYSLNYSANAEIFNADDGIGINYKEDRWYA